LRLAGSILLFFLLTAVVQAADESIAVRVEGLSGPARANAEAALALPQGMIREGKIDRLWLERFERQIPRKVRDAMEPFGFYKASVDVEGRSEESGRYHLKVRVVAGEPVRIGSISLRVEGPGAHERAIKRLLDGFPLAKGDILRQDLYEEEKNKVQKEAANLGYLDAFFSTHAIALSEEKSLATIDLVLNTGPQYRFGDVVFRGAPSYPESFLGRFLDFKTGDVFSYEKIARTQVNFIGADRFRSASVIPRKEEAQQNRVPTEIKLEPMPEQRVKFGIGFGTDTGVRGTVVYQDVNVAHTGHSWQSELKGSRPLQSLMTRYIIPDKKDTKSQVQFSGGYQREDLPSKTSKVLSAEGEYARSLGLDRLGSLYVRMQQERSKAGDERTDTFLLMPGARFSHRHRDNITRPTRGYFYEMELRGSNEAIGSSPTFIQYLAYGEGLVPLPGRLSVLLRAQFGSTAITGAAEDLPISVRFFAGGDRSVRGYSYQSLGPTDSSGDVVGGKQLVVGNIELERAVGAYWGVVAFYDTGNAFNNFSSMDLAQGAGLGVRYYTVVGPVRLDLARQIGVRDPGFRLHFSMGIGL
jgi:translocation and assembly module TamA